MAAFRDILTLADSLAIDSTVPGVIYTPAVGDLIVLYVLEGASNSTPDAGDDAGDGEFDRIFAVQYASNNSTLSCHVRKKLVDSTKTRIFRAGFDPTLLFDMHVVAISGMTLTGADAVRGFGTQANRAANTTPGPALSGAALTTNVTIGALGSDITPINVAPPASWTERANFNIETVTRDSGFTGTTVTWASNVVGATYASSIIELNGAYGVSGVSKVYSFPSSTVFVGKASEGDNTRRFATSGGNIIRSEGEGSLKTQVFGLSTGNSGTDPNRGKGLVSGNEAIQLLTAIKARKQEKLNIYKEMRDSMIRAISGAPPYYPEFVPPLPTPENVLGSRLSLYYGGDSTKYSGGTWTPTVGSSTWTQATGGSQPTADTSTLANSNLSLSFNGTTQELGTNGNNQTDHLIELTNWPAIANYQRMMFFIFKTSSSALEVAIRFNATTTSVDGTTHLIASSAIAPGTAATSNSTVNSGAIFRYIIIGDDTSKVGTIYLNGVAQTTTGNYSQSDFGSPGEWGSSNPDFGSAGGSSFWSGNLGMLGFAITAAGDTFSAIDISKLDSALKLIATGSI